MLVLAGRAPANLEKPAVMVQGASSRMPWAWDGLCFAVPILDGTLDGLRDMVTGTRPTTVANPLWSRDNRGNPALRLTAAGGYVVWPHHPIYDTPSTALTAMVRVRRFGTPDTLGGMFCKLYSDGAPPYTTWEIQATGALDRRVRGTVTIGSSVHVSAESTELSIQEDVNVVLRWTSGSPIIMSVFGERGSQQHQAETGTPTGPLAYTAEGIRLNAGKILSANYAGHYTQAMLWSRQLTDAECTQLAADPFGWCSPRRETVTLAGPFPVVGHGPVQIGTSGQVLMEAPADAYGRVTEVTVTTPADQGTTLRMVVDGIEETEVVAADDTYTRPVDVYTETVEEIELQSDPDPGG